MRLPWNINFPSVVVHHPRETVRRHWCYKLAKLHRDEKRALLLCEQLHQEDALGRLYDLTFDVDPAPVVVTPARPYGGTTNALGRTFARYVAQELGFDVYNEIYQSNSVKRDQITSPFYRLSQSPEFSGPVTPGSNYLLADDIFTMGGTLASLRGFIETHGGVVVGMTALGEKEGNDVQISLANQTLGALSAVHHGALAALVPQRTGFALDCLTEPEGQYLLGQPSADAIRAGFSRASDS